MEEINPVVVFSCSIMGITFIPKTHLFFTCGKDGAVKQWDADTFNHITSLKPAHHGEVWSIASSQSGMSLVTSSHDKSLRVWEKCDEVLVLEEEREMERERQMDKELEQEDNPVVRCQISTKSYWTELPLQLYNNTFVKQ